MSALISAWAGVAPFRDSIENRLIAFFDRNPDEELTPSDAVVKFGGRLNSTACVMRDLAARGLLTKRRDGRFIVYGATA